VAAPLDNQVLGFPGLALSRCVREKQGEGRWVGCSAMHDTLASKGLRTYNELMLKLSVATNFNVFGEAAAATSGFTGYSYFLSLGVARFLAAQSGELTLVPLPQGQNYFILLWPYLWLGQNYFILLWPYL
jgi:hypothetical protein